MKEKLIKKETINLEDSKEYVGGFGKEEREGRNEVVIVISKNKIILNENYLNIV